MSGKREIHTKKKDSPGWLQQHRDWVAGLDRGQKIKYRLFQALVVIAALAIVLCLGLKAWIRLPDIPTLPTGTDTTQDGETGFEGAELPEVAKSGQRPGVYTFLLVGQDTGGGGNTDTIILFTFDTNEKTIHGMSLPRDTMINSSHSGAGHRLNAVYNYNKGSDPDTQLEKGMAALKTEVGKLTGIVPNFYVVVQWEAVGQLVDAIDGVWFEVPFDMDYDDPYQDLHIHQEAGYRLLSGDDAMQGVRWRKNNTGSSGGDVARIPIQQDFLKAAISQCLKPEILLKAPSLAQIFMENVETDLSIGNILAFAQLAAGMDTENNVNFVTMPWVDAKYPGVSMILPDVDQLLELLNDGFNPYQDEIQSSDLQVLYRNSDGSYGVTGGTLLDSSLSRPRGSSSSSSSSGQSGSGSGGGSTSGEPQEPVTEEPVTDPSGSQTTPDPGTGDTSGGTTGGGETPQPGGDSSSGGSTPPSGGDVSQPSGPSGGQGETNPSGSQSGTGGGEAVSPPVSEPSQDVPAGDGLTVTDLPDWLNPTGMETAA